MDAKSFVRMHNPAALALAARMKRDPKERIRLALDFFVSLSETAIRRKDQKLVTNFFSRYQPLTDQETLQLEMELGKVKPDAAKEAVMNLTNPFIELGKQRGRQEGLQQGLQQGLHQGEAEMVLRLLARRLGALSSSQGKTIRRLPLRKIEDLGEALLDFTSIADLARWLRNNKKR